MPSGISTPKFSATVAPITANVSVSGSPPLPLNDGEYATNGTFSLVWSVPLYVGSFPWSAVIMRRSSSLSSSSNMPRFLSNFSIFVEMAFIQREKDDSCTLPKQMDFTNVSQNYEAGTKVLASQFVFGLSRKTQWLSGLYYADFISFYSPTQLCGGGTTKSNSNELPISVPLSRNRIPRKSLNYQSPYQVFLSYLKSLT